MSRRQRQFAQIRSKSNSKNHSLRSSSVLGGGKHQLFNSLIYHNDDCVNCINKKLAISRKQQEVENKREQIKQHLQTIKKLNSMRDYQQEKRDQMLNQASEYNKSMICSQRQSQRNLKKCEDSIAVQQIQNKQRQYALQQQNFKNSRKQLQRKYQKQIRNQLKEEIQRKKHQLSREKLLNPSQVNKHKVIDENEKYVNLMKQQRQKCMKQNKKQLIEKSLIRHEEKQTSLKLDFSHMERVEKDFESFSQFKPLQQSPYRKSRTILSSENNPEDIFIELKRKQFEKNSNKISQRQINNIQRLNQLQKQEEQNRLKVHKKISSMRTYVQDLTNQLLQKRTKQRQQIKYTKYYQPEKSRVDYFTQELKLPVQQCHTCEKVYKKRYF